MNIPDDPFRAATTDLIEWLAALPLDGSDTERSRQLQAQITEQLKVLDRGSDTDRRNAELIRTLIERVNQRRAGRRAEN